MVKDLVCGSDVDETKSILKVDKDGATYFFCCTKCVKKFKSDSQKYLKVPAK